MEKYLLDVLNGKRTPRPPVWMMRQAGRYLPEYRKTRENAGSFLQMCDSADFATEVTCQPIMRYGFDGAIIFADILLLPRALGQNVWFEGGIGPKLDPLSAPDAYKTLEKGQMHTKLAPVYKALEQTKAKLPAGVTLLGFCGAPWTVACYMLNGGGSKDWATVRAEAYKNPKKMAEFLVFLAECSAEYLAEQVKVGAEAVQVFDSWAGAVPPELEDLLLKEPILILAQRFKALCPKTPLILFSKGARPPLLEFFAKTELFACLALDEKADLLWAREALTPHVAVQGNLDNALLLTTPENVREKTTQMLDKIALTGRYIVNLGHGVLPQTPLENVEAFVKTVQNWAK